MEYDASPTSQIRDGYFGGVQALRELFADVPDLLERVDALQPGKAMMVVQGEGENVAVARLR